MKPINKAVQGYSTLPKYLAELEKRVVANQWPEDYFDKLGTWEGEPLQRPNQGTIELRESLD